jgi:membrane fusion protein (multidrug efflux system)
MKNVILALTFISIFIYACSEEKTAAPAATAPSAEVITIGAGNATTQKDFTASLQGKVDVEIRPQVDGFLDKVFVDEGAFVKQGQPLFKINDLPYKQQLNNASASLQAAEAAITNAQLEIDKLTPLVENKVVSDYQLNVAKAAYKIATANAAQAKAVVAAAQINLGYTLISAPVSGYIGRLPKKQGSLVSRSDPQALTQLSDVHEVYAYFSLGETDFIDFKAQYEGETIEEKLKRLPAVSLVLADNTVFPTPGKIDMVDGQFDKNTGAITVRAIFPNGQGLLRSGNTGKVRLGMQHSGSLLVPQQSTVEVQDKVYVYMLGDSNKVNKQPISIEGKTATDYIVKDGLKAGDRIVYSALDRLQEGAAVTPEKPKTDAQLSMKN